MIIAGTGSRSLATEVYSYQQEVFMHLRNELRILKPSLLISGGAEGWDHMITLAARTLGIPYHLYLPSHGYLRYYWQENSITHQDQSRDAIEMKKGAEKIEYTQDLYKTSQLKVGGVHVNFLRNQQMVDLADYFVVYDPSSSGTRDCVQRIQKAGKPWKEIK